MNHTETRFLVVGGLAAVLHGVGRMTIDLDVVIELNQENILNAFQALEPLGYQPRVPVTAAQFADTATRESWVREKGMTVLNLHSNQHQETPIDLFVTHPFSFNDVYHHSILEKLEDDTEFRFVDLHTLIAMKETAGRPKDLLDIKQLRKIAKLEEL